MSHVQPAHLILPWAKSNPFRPLLCHLIDAGSVAERLMSVGPFQVIVPKFQAASGCPPDGVVAWLSFLVALHDIGKGWVEFQVNSPNLSQALQDAGFDLSYPQQGFRHDAGTKYWVLNYLQTTHGWEETAAETVAVALGGHHGAFHLDPPPYTDRPQWETLRQAIAQRLWEVFQPPAWRPAFAHHDVAGTLLAGLTVLSDWIASNKELFQLTWSGGDVEAYISQSRTAATRAVKALGLGAPPIWSKPMSFREVWPEITCPNAVQRACEPLVREELAPGLVLIEAPTGSGKTEAAIFLASQWATGGHAAGLYMALPTTATANNIHKRLREGFAKHDREAARRLRLVHGTSWLVDEQTPELAPELSDERDPDAGERALDWFRPTKRGLLAPDGAGTIDQALKAAQPVKHGFLRLFGLAGKVLVVDEVHAYDPFMRRILTRLLEWCRALSVPVILLSATLPQNRRELLVRAYSPVAELRPLPAGKDAPYPLITWVEPNGQVRPVTVQSEEPARTFQVKRHFGLLGRPAEIAALAKERASGGGCIAIVVNTVRLAQEIYDQLNDLPSNVERFLIHSRFPLAERVRLEDEITARFGRDAPDRPSRAIVVGTQVLEQSLDVDFDELITEVAPIDLLLQRAGRVHRHKRPPRPTGPVPILHILLPPEGAESFGTTEHVYHRYILLRTLLALNDPQWVLPQQMRELVEQVYAEVPAPGETDALRAAREAWEREENEDRRKADRFLVKSPYAGSFKLGHPYQTPLEDQEGDSNSYFAAKTRLGDEQVRVLLVDGEDWSRLLADRRPPGRHQLQAIYSRTVAVPARWFHKAVPEEGYSLPEPGPVWLQGIHLLFLRNGRWLARREDGTPFAVVVDQVKGVCRTIGKGEGLHGVV